LTEISGFLDGCRGEVYAAIEEMPEARLEQVPAAGGWSAAQVLEHLALAESKTSQYLAARLAKAIAAGLAREQAPEVVVPAAGVTAAAALADLRASHAEVHALLRSADGWALASVLTRHALFGPMQMYQSLLFIGYHDRRHLPQIVRAAAAA
jgi:uncharacterized damage-inducible protein DinB